MDYLRTHFQNDKISVAAAYLNHKESDVQSPSNILAGLWWQLVSQNPLSAQVQQLYQKHQKQRTRPSLDEIRDILRSAISEYSRVFIVVDALDEYPENKRHILLEVLAVMGDTVSLMLTSRPHIAPGSLFADAQVLEIRAKEDDIRHYVEAHLRTSFRLSTHVTARPELRGEIESQVISNVDGMQVLSGLEIMYSEFFPQVPTRKTPYRLACHQEHC